MADIITGTASSKGATAGAPKGGAGGDSVAPTTAAGAEPSAAFRHLAGVLAKDERHGIRGAMVTDFFAGGSLEGPFAGARSAQGEWMASTFYAHARPMGGLFATVKPSPYTDGGGRLHNHGRIG